jgi:hypothetical protein
MHARVNTFSPNRSRSTSPVSKQARKVILDRSRIEHQFFSNPFLKPESRYNLLSVVPCFSFLARTKPLALTQAPTKVQSKSHPVKIAIYHFSQEHFLLIVKRELAQIAKLTSFIAKSRQTEFATSRVPKDNMIMPFK